MKKPASGPITGRELALGLGQREQERWAETDLPWKGMASGPLTAVGPCQDEKLAPGQWDCTFCFAAGLNFGRHRIGDPGASSQKPLQKLNLGCLASFVLVPPLARVMILGKLLNFYKLLFSPE